MLKNLSFVAISLLGMATTSAATLPTPSFATVTILQRPITKIQETATKEVVPDKKLKEKRLTCEGCNSYELKTLNALYQRGITDKVAIATILANIKQESRFVANVCQGGIRVPYHQCRTGGYGLIQFTSSERYHGLGRYAAITGGNPSSFDTQLNYIFTEKQWKQIEHKLKIPNMPIHYYMNLAYSWLGWGIKGPRKQYVYDYLNRFNYEASIA